MYITCQKCKASFVINPEQIGLKGRKVRCSKCQHTWYVDPMLAPKPRKVVTPEAELLKSPSSGVHLPIVLSIKPQKHSSDWIILLIMFLVFGFAIFFSKSVDLDFINKSTRDLIISDVKIYRIKDRDEMILSYKITNDSDKVATMPDIRISLFDTEHNSVKTYDMIGGEAELEPHQHLKFRTEFTSVSKEAETADVTIGSKLDFIFR